MLEKMQGIVIKTQDYGETHKIVTLFSNKLGKIAAIARGAKKPKAEWLQLRSHSSLVNSLFTSTQD